ncbi:MAG: hypothetical protein ABIF40_00510 [archaeon]
MKELFNGELLISDSNVFTNSHLYQHSETGVLVRLLGMNHAGTEKYFQAVQNELEGSQKVLYESSGGPKTTFTTTFTENLEELFEQELIVSEDKRFRSLLPILYEAESDGNFNKVLTLIKDTDIMNAYGFTLRSYFLISSLYHDLDKESLSFDSENWEAVDMLMDEKAGQQNENELMEAFSNLDKSKLLDTISYVMGKIRKIDLKKHEISDFGKTFYEIYHDETVVNAFLSVLGNPRDEYLFKRFDEVVQDEDLMVLGIKYGAGHISNQRKLLEDRGYVLQRTKKIKIF